MTYNWQVIGFTETGGIVEILGRGRQTGQAAWRYFELYRSTFAY